MGQVTFRGGVYRQVAYCPSTADFSVEFGLQYEQDRTKWQTGVVAQTGLRDEKSCLLVTMNLMQFLTEDLTEPVQAGEKLYYLFQLESCDGISAEYYPIMLRVDASLNLDDIAATGDSIVA